jgi:hypothetical protein
VATASVRVRYRPVKIGWCIRDDNWEDLGRSLRLTHVLWGGRFNPLIPVGAACAEQLVRQFRTDILLDIADDAQIKSFIKKFEYLPWPLFEPALFRHSGKFHTPNFLDITHPLSKIADELQHQNDSFGDTEQFAMLRWDKDDDLANVLLATFGAYPTADEINRDYGRYVTETINPSLEGLKKDDAVPASLLNRLTPSALSAEELNWDRIPNKSTLGFYVGGTNDFKDIVNYWNLRACDIDALFLDPEQMDRLTQLKNAQMDLIHQRNARRGERKEIAVWSRSQEAVVKIGFPATLVPHFTCVDDVDVIRGIHPPLHYFTSKSVLASTSESNGRRTLAFQFPEKPFSLQDEWSSEYFVVSVKPPIGDPDSLYTFWTPYLPELNQWLGRETCLASRTIRAEVDGLAIISNITDESIELNAFKKQDLASRIFKSAGIRAEPSLPGRIAIRLIAQLGGLQGCRVLKIAGVRHLIRKYGPLQEFDRTEAIRIIGDCDPTTGKPRFADYEGLFIEQRDEAIVKLKPEHAFLYLLKRKVFRVGLTLVCPACELNYWVTLDTLSTQMHCELCGSEFAVTTQLKDRAWSYRRSGLFGQGNHQEGGIPVALALQQLDANLSHLSGNSLFLTNLSLSAAGAQIKTCETDIFVARPHGDRIEIVIGECKDEGGKITLDDSAKLAAVADAFPHRHFDVYIVFAKTSTFTEEEIKACHAAQGGMQRVIMLSNRELEPYFMYQKTEQEFEISHSGVSLDAMARVTHDVFFQPRRKKL